MIDGYTHFPKNLGPHQDSRQQMGDTEQVPH